MILKLLSIDRQCCQWQFCEFQIKIPTHFSVQNNWIQINCSRLLFTTFNLLLYCVTSLCAVSFRVSIQYSGNFADLYYILLSWHKIQYHHCVHHHTVHSELTMKLQLNYNTVASPHPHFVSFIIITLKNLDWYFLWSHLSPVEIHQTLQMSHCCCLNTSVILHHLQISFLSLVWSQPKVFAVIQILSR